ncbi:Eukaryotic translation initiation factor 3 subunit H [Rhizoclosmatium hyalinum]|nr:Eukaryotic translation initiation factor 3 subunit H [Rhizoclosmatium hyalinum]
MQSFSRAAAAAAFAAHEEAERLAEESRIKGTYNREPVPLAQQLKGGPNTTRLGDKVPESVLDGNADFTVDLAGIDAAKLASVPVVEVALDAAAVAAIAKAAKSVSPAARDSASSSSAQSLPATHIGGVHGVLLGLDICGVLEVTNVVPAIGPVAPILEDGSVAPGPAGDHQLRALDGLARLGFDSNVVGLFVAANMGAFWSQQLLETLFRHQKANPQAVLIIYDPLRSAQGNLSLKALRLSASTFSLMSSKKFSLESIHAANVSPSTLFESLPIKVKNSSLVNVMLNNFDISLLSTLSASLESSSSSGSLSTTAASVNATGVGAVSDKSTAAVSSAALLASSSALSNLLLLSPNYEGLDLGAGEVYLEKHLESLCDAVDDYGQEQWRWQGWNRSLQKEQQKAALTVAKKRAENAARESNGQAPLYPEADITTPPASLTRVIANEPSRLESLVLAGQVETWCKQINGFAGPGLTKMYVTKAVSRG